MEKEYGEFEMVNGGVVNGLALENRNLKRKLNIILNYMRPSLGHENTSQSDYNKNYVYFYEKPEKGAKND